MTLLNLLKKKDPVFAPQKAVRPPDKWINWYLVTSPLGVVETFKTPNVYLPPGAFVHGERVWPTKEIAEEKAIIYLEKFMGDPNYPIFKLKDCYKYLGAYPEGKHPKNA